MSDTKLARRVQVFIGEEASRSLDALIQRTGENQTALIERLLMEANGQPRRYEAEQRFADQGILDAMSREPEPESYADQKARRDEKKAARAQRKAELQSSVKAALLVNPDRMIRTGEAANLYRIWARPGILFSSSS